MVSVEHQSHSTQKMGRRKKIPLQYLDQQKFELKIPEFPKEGVKEIIRCGFMKWTFSFNNKQIDHEYIMKKLKSRQKVRKKYAKGKDKKRASKWRKARQGFLLSAECEPDSENMQHNPNLSFPRWKVNAMIVPNWKESQNDASSLLNIPELLDFATTYGFHTLLRLVERKLVTKRCEKLCTAKKLNLAYQHRLYGFIYALSKKINKPTEIKRHLRMKDLPTQFKELLKRRMAKIETRVSDIEAKSKERREQKRQRREKKRKCDGLNKGCLITHQGRSSSSGHYVAWVRIGDEDEKSDTAKWVVCDDSNISPVSEEEILKLCGGGDWHCNE
uniref:ubiquitinyl hydrolase 1 n=1 Tax=Globodera rostochiensis TaxID=31243 RepID=A0A914H9G8_GLORO